MLYSIDSDGFANGLGKNRQTALDIGRYNTLRHCSIVSLTSSWARALVGIALLAMVGEVAFAEPAARRRWYTESPVATSAAGDFSDWEELSVRLAALEALGNLNGSVVVLDADTGRALTIVNQKLALSDGYIPCSTIKLPVAVAALSEKVVVPAERVWFPGRWYMTVVEGLAISNNVIFEALGRKLGFEVLERYARWMGFGEKAGWQLLGEQVAPFPSQEYERGVGLMSSFGYSIRVSPLQMAAFTAALANGGTLNYIQHPRSEDEYVNFEPRRKRWLPTGSWLAEVRKGMAESVRRGTGRRARTPNVKIWGKTGTCSVYEPNSGTRLGWFTSFGEGPDRRRLVVVVMLRGNSTISGPLAADVAGRIYGRLAEGVESASD